MLNKHLKKLNISMYIFFLFVVSGTSYAAANAEEIGCDSDFTRSLPLAAHHTVLHENPEGELQGQANVDKAWRSASEFSQNNKGVQDMPESPRQTIERLISKKNNYCGDGLNDEIQPLKKRKPFLDLTAASIKSCLEPLSPENFKEKKESMAEVTVFIKNGDDKSENSEEFTRAILGAAYFPAALDPRTKSLHLITLSRFKFIHRQLADALYYGHPLARDYMREIMFVCNSPLRSADLFSNFLPITDTKEYSQYLVRITLPIVKEDSGAKVDQDVADKGGNEIDFPSYSKELGEYFQQVLDPEQNPDKRSNKRKR